MTNRKVFLTIRVLDSDNPVASRPNVSIRAVNNSVTEGEPARFEISLDPAMVTHHHYDLENGVVNTSMVPNTAVVSLKLSQIGNSFGTGVTTSQLFTVNGTGIFEVPTRDSNGIDDSATKTSSITVELGLRNGHETSYRIAENPNNRATVTIADETRPRLTISANNSEVAEGGQLNFEVTVIPTGREIEFDYWVAESGNFLASNELGLKQATVSNTTEININTKSANNQFEPDSLVSVQLVADQPEYNSDGTINTPATYIVGTSGSASTLVTDGSTPTGGLAIIAFKDSIIEGERARFQIRSIVPVTEDISVIVRFANNTPGRDFIVRENLDQLTGIGQLGTLDHVVTIQSGQSRVNFSVPTKDLAEFGHPATISATIQANAVQYSIASGRDQQTITVYSNDANYTANVSVQDNRTSITEGDELPLLFEIELAQTQTSTPIDFPVDGIWVHYTISQSGGNFIFETESDPNPRWYRAHRYSRAGQKSYKFTRPGTLSIGIYNQIDPGNTDGEVTVTINE